MTVKNVLQKHSWAVYAMAFLFLWFVHQEIDNLQSHFSRLKVHGVVDQNEAKDSSLDLRTLSMLKIESEMSSAVSGGNVDEAFLDSQEPEFDAYAESEKDIEQSAGPEVLVEEIPEEFIADTEPSESKQDVAYAFIENFVESLSVQGFSNNGAWVEGRFVALDAELDYFPVRLAEVDIDGKEIVFEYEDQRFVNQEY